MKAVETKTIEQLYEKLVNREVRDSRRRLDIANVQCLNDSGEPEIEITFDDGVVKRIGTHWAMRQFCNDVIEIPLSIFALKFVTREARNFVFQHRVPRAIDRKFLIREQKMPENKFLLPMDGMGIRAFVHGEPYKNSYGYQIIDHDEVVKHIMDSGITEGRQMNVFMNYDNMRIRIIDSEPMEVRGEELDYGIEIRNGETKQTGLHVRLFLKRIVCTNGLVIRPMNLPDIVRHAGKPETVQERFNGVLDKVVERINQLPPLIERAMKVRIKKPKTIRDQIEAVAKSMNISKKYYDEIEEAYKNNPLLPKEGTESLWDLVQAFTSFANNKKKLEKTMKIQDASGDLLLFPGKFNLATIKN